MRFLYVEERLGRMSATGAQPTFSQDIVEVPILGGGEEEVVGGEQGGASARAKAVSGGKEKKVHKREEMFKALVGQET